ncbi:MAG: penicillin-binding protein 2 [Chloroherpetonaceae bacterium]|nr:penicillin-binding protein 2 [Chloroherpetonaceae bacterium]MDW8019364.1 penicillin-binding protein 2 [Chloroherpetonaceae bacterium]
MQDKSISPLIYGALSLIFAVLVGRLFYLQVISSQALGQISSQNSVRKIPVDASRGTIYDRNGIPIVENQPQYSVQIVPAEFDKTKLPEVAALLGVSEQFLADKIKEAESYSRYAPSRILRDISFPAFCRLQEHLWRLPGIDVVMENKRKYPRKDFSASHVLGYTKFISKQMLEKLPKDIYARDDIIGYAGLEKTYEEYLRGQRGYKLMIVNSLGKQIAEYEGGAQHVPAQRGSDLFLTLDASLQAVAESLLTATGKSGSIVALNPQNGEVLAMVSKPDYDPALLEGSTDAATWNALVKDPKNPLFNRTTQTRYPPGSTFKMICAIAALEEKVITPSTIFGCSGYFKFGDKNFLCHRGKGHGGMDVVRAIQHSCNSYFYQLVLRVGLDRWAKYASLFGFGEKTGLDIADEQTPPLPTREYFNKRYGPYKVGWHDGFLVNLGIGQGDIGATPIQMARYVAALANLGTLVQPHLLRAYRDKQTGELRYPQFEHKPLPISKTTLDIVRNGMRLCVSEGTGRAAQVPGIEVAGKTGTAQNPHGEDHAWFIGFAPYDKPTIAVCVLVENAGFGGAVAAPIAGKLIEHYLRRMPAQDSTQTLLSLSVP